MSPACPRATIVALGALGQARASTPPLCLKPEHAEDLKGKETQQPIHADHEGKAERRAKRKQKRHGAQPGKTNLPKPNILAHNYYHCHKHTHCIVSPPTRNSKPVAAVGGDENTKYHNQWFLAASLPPSWQVEREIPQKARPNDVRSGNDFKPHNPVKPITSPASPIFYHTTTTIAINTPMESCPHLPGMRTRLPR